MLYSSTALMSLSSVYLIRIILELSLIAWIYFYEIDVPGHTSAISKSHPEFIACEEAQHWASFANGNSAFTPHLRFWLTRLFQNHPLANSALLMLQQWSSPLISSPPPRKCSRRNFSALEVMRSMRTATWKIQKRNGSWTLLGKQSNKRWIRLRRAPTRRWQQRERRPLFGKVGDFPPWYQSLLAD